MNGLHAKDIVIHDQDGTPAPAKLQLCECGNETWHVYLLNATHLHLQCTACGTSYCDGRCDWAEWREGGAIP